MAQLQEELAWRELFEEQRHPERLEELVNQTIKGALKGGGGKVSDQFRN